MMHRNTNTPRMILVFDHRKRHLFEGKRMSMNTRGFRKSLSYLRFFNAICFVRYDIHLLCLSLMEENKAKTKPKQTMMIVDDDFEKDDVLLFV